MSGGIELTKPASDRDGLRTAGSGFVAWTYPPPMVTNQTIMVTQKMEAALVGLKAGDSISKVWFIVQTAAASLSLAKVAIYSADGQTLHASSSSFHAALNGATDLQSGSLSSAFVVPSDGAYYAALLTVGTTPPTVYRASAVAAIHGAIAGSGVRSWASMSGQADLPAAATWAAATASWWVAVS